MKENIKESIKENIKEALVKSICFFCLFTLVCGVIYTVLITGVSQLFFSGKANGSIIEVNGKTYGSALLGQQYTDESHMWGRIMNIDTGTFTDKDGNAVMYAAPSNLSPASKEYEQLVTERVKRIKEIHYTMGDTPIPVDLVTASGSGLDPHISVAAARYQIGRIAENTDRTTEEIQQIIDDNTDKKFLGILGEKRVNVLKVNLALDGIL